MTHYTLADYQQQLAAKQISSLELTEFFLKQIKAQEQLNSFITVCDDVAREQAKQADSQRAQGKAGPLTGLPFAHKDIFCTQGIKTSCASKMLDNFIAPYNATLVDKMAAAGMVMLGKTNMDEFAMGSSNENSFYGAVKNPWDLDYVPGGSSGGSAAAVAARIVPAATGTDTGGSIRQPAAFCGITGLKPTYGRTSRYGMIAFASSLDQAGPMTQTAQDAAILLNTMAGFDPRDSTSLDVPVPDYTANLNDSLKGLRIGIVPGFFGNGLHADIQAAIDNSKKVLEQLGATFVEIDLPHHELAIPTYYVIASAECSSNLARYDGVRYGYRAAKPENLLDLYQRSRSEAFGSEVKRRIMLGTYVLSSGYYDAYYIKAQKARRLLSEDFQNAFKNVDVILSPTTPDPAFKIAEKSNDPVKMYLSDIYTIAVNMAGLPAINIPCGFSGKLPVGMQFIGNHLTESKLLNIAHQFQQHTDHHQKAPEISL
ncbi:MAG: Asp-tRNA(Asn)/Glu-tRNA(Gln) amidotransferase subunit GatA [Legionellales bacterium]|jgi:aspartyl-tRNA(Asn)/glutamyl-tRNA(Gln) amidotransferase subunit A